MAIYEIVETPGKAVAELEGKPCTGIKNQDEAKAILAKLRAVARKEKRKVDFIIRRTSDQRSPSNGVSSATSIRLTEEVRARLARRVGKHMYETGENISMGDLVVKLIEQVEFCEKNHGDDDTDDEDDE